jgi:flagellar hook-associated protein 1 FlgK
MAGLFSSLSSASQSLDAQRYGLDVTGQNIANLNTEGYTRRRIELAERPALAGVGGVEVLGVRAVRDAFVDQRLRSELPAESYDQAMSSSLAVVETTLGTAGSGIDGRLAALFNAFQSLSLDPQSSVARDGVVLEGTRLSTAFNDMSRRLQASAQQADADVRTSVAEINRLSATIATLNQQIGDANGADTEALRDQLDVALQQLSRLTSISIIAQPQGTFDVSTGAGRALVVGTKSYDLTVTSAPGTGLAEIRAGGVDITGEIRSGSIGGLLDFRDQVIPDYQAQLDQLAYDVAQQVNSVHAAGYDLSGSTGQNFFQPIASVAGAASAIRVDPAITADASRIAASTSGALGDNGNAKALAALRNSDLTRGGTATFVESWGLLVNRIGSDSAAAKSSLATRQDIVAAVQRMRDSVSGVSLDEEAGRLLQFQRAYEANARFFSAIDQTLQTLMATFGAIR